MTILVYLSLFEESLSFIDSKPPSLNRGDRFFSETNPVYDGGGVGSDEINI